MNETTSRENRSPTAWPAAAYIDPWISIDIDAYYYREFLELESAVSYDPKKVASDMLDALTCLLDGFFLPRAITFSIGDVSDDLTRLHDVKHSIVVDHRLIAECGQKIQSRLSPSTQWIEVESLDAATIREAVQSKVISKSDEAPARAVHSIKVMAAQFTDLPSGHLEKEDLEPKIHIDELSSGYTVTIQTDGRPLEFSLSIWVQRGHFGVKGLSGTERLQDRIRTILASNPLLDETQPFEPLPADHRSLTYYT
jgi:hypothetical protein